MGAGISMGGYELSSAMCTGIKQWGRLEDHLALMDLKETSTLRSTPVATCHSFCLSIALEALVSASRKDPPLVPTPQLTVTRENRLSGLLVQAVERGSITSPPSRVSSGGVPAPFACLFCSVEQRNKTFSHAIICPFFPQEKAGIIPTAHADFLKCVILAHSSILPYS